MRLLLKVFAIVLALAVLFMAGFELWGEQLERVFNQEACTRWFAQSKPYAWALGIGLLIADIVLPIPATGVMAALGSVYGIFGGAFIGVLGSAGAGVIGYIIARFLGKRATRFIASEEEIERFQAFFDKWGGTAIIISRIMPILPEVMAILAGFAKMNLRRFLAALLFGTVPTCFLFAYLGHASRSQPAYGMILAVLIPLVIWPLFLKFVLTKETPAN